jgi:hypothetical protein
MQLLTTEYNELHGAYEFTYKHKILKVETNYTFQYPQKNPPYAVYRAWMREANESTFRYIKAEREKAWASFNEKLEDELDTQLAAKIAQTQEEDNDTGQ